MQKFVPSAHNVQEDITQIRLEEYNTWCIGCHVIPIYSNSEAKIISSFIGIKILLSNQSVILTICAFTLVLP